MKTSEHCLHSDGFLGEYRGVAVCESCGSLAPKLNILRWPNKDLETRCSEVLDGYSTDSLRSLTDRMFVAMREHNGCGLAAPQVGILKRIFVMDTGNNPVVFINPIVIPISNLGRWPAEIDGSDVVASAVTRALQSAGVYIKPSTLVKVQEACLSFPGLQVTKERMDRVGVLYENLERERIVNVFEGLEAQCVQHEAEHLDGITFASEWGPVRRKMMRAKLAKIERS